MTKRGRTTLIVVGVLVFVPALYFLRWTGPCRVYPPALSIVTDRLPGDHRGGSPDIEVTWEEWPHRSSPDLFLYRDDCGDSLMLLDGTHHTTLDLLRKRVGPVLPGGVLVDWEQGADSVSSGLRAESTAHHTYVESWRHFEAAGHPLDAFIVEFQGATVPLPAIGVGFPFGDFMAPTWVLRRWGRYRVYYPMHGRRRLLLERVLVNSDELPDWSNGEIDPCLRYVAWPERQFGSGWVWLFPLAG